MATDVIPAAAIDIGSNTVHMLAGRVRDGRVEPVDEASELVGLAEDVYAGGAISPERLQRAVDALAQLVERARSNGADDVALVATAAVRDASNAPDLASAVRERTGLDLQLIPGEREAALTYRGAAAGEGAPSLQVCDVGGGSTEVIRAERDRVILATSLPIGSSRLSRALSADPPRADELDHVEAEAARALDTLPAWRPERLIVTGGTATALARLAGTSERRYTMGTDELAHLREVLAARASADVAAEHGIEPKRARLLPAGATIIAALCERAGADEVVLTAAGLRDGLLIEQAAREE